MFFPYNHCVREKVAAPSRAPRRSTPSRVLRQCLADLIIVEFFNPGIAGGWKCVHIGKATNPPLRKAFSNLPHHSLDAPGVSILEYDWLNHQKREMPKYAHCRLSKSTISSSKAAMQRRTIGLFYRVQPVRSSAHSSVTGRLRLERFSPTQGCGTWIASQLLYLRLQARYVEFSPCLGLLCVSSP